MISARWVELQHQMRPLADGSNGKKGDYFRFSNEDWKIDEAFRGPSSRNGNKFRFYKLSVIPAVGRPLIFQPADECELLHLIRAIWPLLNMAEAVPV